MSVLWFDKIFFLFSDYLSHMIIIHFFIQKMPVGKSKKPILGSWWDFRAHKRAVLKGNWGSKKWTTRTFIKRFSQDHFVISMKRFYFSSFPLKFTPKISSVFRCFMVVVSVGMGWARLKFHALGNYSFISFMSSCRVGARKTERSGRKLHTRIFVFNSSRSPSCECSSYASLRYSKRLWFHKMELWLRTIKRFAMREILFFLDSSLMQQMLLNESTILGSARSNPHGLLHHTTRSSRTCAPISPNPSRQRAMCRMWLLNVPSRARE